MDGNDFDFITPKAFRSNITESIEFAAWLWVVAQSIESKYVDDINRTIILYNIAVIEAILLFRAKKKKIKFLTQEFKSPHNLPATFFQKKKVVVMAFRENNPKPESQIWLNDLIREQEAYLGKKLFADIKELQEVRNTLHLSKKRSERLTLDKSQKSFDALLALVQKVKREFETA